MVSSKVRQTRVGPGWRIARRSVVSMGMLQARYTLLPLRTARRSVTGFASSNEGGMGMPGAPQPASSEVPSTQNKSFEWAGLMETTRVPEGGGEPHWAGSASQFPDRFAEYAGVLVDVVPPG